jgi:hypothetical protein
MALEQSGGDRRSRALVITSDPHDAKMVRESVASLGGTPFELEWASSLSDGIDRLQRLSIGAVILDLFCLTAMASRHSIKC